MFPIPLFPQTFEHIATYNVFFNSSMLQCRWPIQTYIQEILPKQCFSQRFYNVSREKRGNLHDFRHKVGPKHKFGSVFHALASKTLQNIAIYNGFSFLAVFPLPEAYQNDQEFHFNTLLNSDNRKSSKNLANTT